MCSQLPQGSPCLLITTINLSLLTSPDAGYPHISFLTLRSVISLLHGKHVSCYKTWRKSLVYFLMHKSCERSVPRRHPDLLHRVFKCICGSFWLLLLFIRPNKTKKKKIIEWESDSRKDPGLAVESCPMELLCSVPGWPWRLQIKQRVNLFTSFSTFYSNCSSDLFWWLMLSGSVSQEHRSASRGEPGVKPTSTFLRSCFIDKPRQT